MPSEPEWSASISSGTVCTWFYILAILNSILAVAGVIAIVIILSKNNRPLGFIVLPLISIVVGVTNAWFMFIMCKRSINNEGFGVKTAIAKSIFNAATGNKYGF